MDATEHGYTEDPRPFLFRGGDLALDFCNTLSPTDGQDRLFDYERLVEFAQQRGVITQAEGRKLRQRAAERPEDAQAVFRSAFRLRNAMLRLFEAVADGRRPPKVELNLLNAWIPKAMSALRLADADHCCGWTWAANEDDLERPLHPIVRSAAELLTTPERITRVRACAADDCRWLFEDTSKNRSRRWCDMADCGNRAKARRHYHRAKEDA